VIRAVSSVAMPGLSGAAQPLAAILPDPVGQRLSREPVSRLLSLKRREADLGGAGVQIRCKTRGGDVLRNSVRPLLQRLVAQAGQASQHLPVGRNAQIRQRHGHSCAASSRMDQRRLRVIT
jgi:hypothetical protein